MSDLMEAKPVPEVSLSLCVPQLVSGRATTTPNRIAVAAGSEVLTYSELERQANQLARYLQSAGVGAGSVVAVYLERSAEFVVSALAILKSGAAYLPLDPDSPAERIAFLLQDSGASAVITSATSQEHLPNGSWRVVELSRHAAQIREQLGTPPAAQSHPRDLAYV